MDTDKILDDCIESVEGLSEDEKAEALGICVDVAIDNEMGRARIGTLSEVDPVKLDTALGKYPDLKEAFGKCMEEEKSFNRILAENGYESGLTPAGQEHMAREVCAQEVLNGNDRVPISSVMR